MKNKYEIFGGYTEIYIERKNGKKFSVIIDTEDLDRLLDLGGSWYVTPGKNTWYATQKPGKTTLRMQRFIMNAPRNLFVDHVNGNGLDNRKCNLRLVTNAQNLQNRNYNPKSKSGVRGVYWDARKRMWRACVTLNGKNNYLGVYKTIEEADAVVKLAREKLMPYSN